LNVYFDGRFEYWPAANYVGTDSFTFVVNDGMADSNIATVNITVVPAAPTNLSAAPNGKKRVILKWTQSSTIDIVGNRVYRATTSGGPYALLYTSSTPITSYSDSSVASGTTYYYVVTAKKSGQESAYSNQAFAKPR